MICGRNSDAEKDVVENAKRRWPAVRFEIREVAVQGAAAVVEVSTALKELDANPDVEVIIITRGGGSFEDLLPFSDEGLVRLVAGAKTPIVSAIGHEKDAPLLDLVADWRASTPTDAGKKVVPDMAEELQKITNLQQRAFRTIASLLTFEKSRITGLRDRPVLQDPFTLISSRREVISGLLDRSFRSTSARLLLGREEISNLNYQVRALSPQATLDRGYAVVQKSDGQILRNPKNVISGEVIKIRLAEGELAALAE